MNANTELLNFIYQNSQMGVDTLSQLQEQNSDAAFQKQLELQLSEYRAIHAEARTLLNKAGCDEKGLSAYEKAKTYLMLNFQTMTDRTASHFAEMLMVGSTMGIVDAIKKLHQYQNDAEADILQLMQRLLAFEERNVEQLKKYL